MKETIRHRKLCLVLQDPAEGNEILEIIQPDHTRVYGGRNAPPSKSANGTNQKSNSADRRNVNPQEHSYPPYKIMVIDNEPDLVDVLKRGLMQRGFRVVGYTNPVVAVSKFARHDYEIVLTDIRMPQMSGIELFSQLRAIDDEVLICFVTAYEQYRQEFEIAHPEEQVGCFIPKPVTIDRLIGTITRKMEERESRWRRKI